MSTSSPGDTPANRSPKPAKGKAKKTRGISGPTSSTPFAHFDPDTHSWKTSEATLLSDSETFSPTLPPAGILRNGRLSPRPRLAHHTAGIASSSWPTPTASDHIERKSTQQKEGSRHSLTLPDAVKRWPTPTAVQRPNEGNVRLLREKVLAGEMTEQEAQAMLGKSVFEAQGKIPALWPTPRSSAAMNEDISKIQKRLDNGTPYKAKLEEAVALWATPRAASAMANDLDSLRNSPRFREQRFTFRRLEEDLARRTELSGKLNPTWVEWLMGFPLGWTDLEDLETQ